MTTLTEFYKNALLLTEQLDIQELITLRDDIWTKQIKTRAARYLHNIGIRHVTVVDVTIQESPRNYEKTVVITYDGFRHNHNDIGETGTLRVAPGVFEKLSAKP
jgi:hypothetical protein